MKVLLILIYSVQVFGFPLNRIQSMSRLHERPSIWDMFWGIGEIFLQIYGDVADILLVRSLDDIICVSPL